MNRRAFLAAATAAATGGLAGCSSAGTVGEKVGGQPTKTLTETEEGSAGRLAFGETLALPRINITVSPPRTTATYRWREDGEERTVDAGDGKQWVFVGVRVENATDRRVRLPLTMDFEGVVGDRVFHPGRNRNTAEKYIGGKVDPGAVREGDVVYLTGDGVTADRFRVRYEEHRPSGEHRVWWEHEREASAESTEREAGAESTERE